MPDKWITQETADQIRKAEIAAILKRLKEGRTITAAQQRLLASESEALKKEIEPGTYTIHELTRLTDRDRKTIEKAIAHCSPAHVAGKIKYYRLSDVEVALANYRGIIAGLREERLKGEKLENQRREMELAEKRQQLVSVDEVLALWGKILLVIRQRLSSLPHEASSAANPTDPKHAMAALQEWADAANKLITQHLPQIATGKPEDEIKIVPLPKDEVAAVQTIG